MSEPVFITLDAPPAEGDPLVTPPAVPAISFHGPPRYPESVRTRLTDDADDIIGRYPQSRSALLPLLHLVQSHDGYLTRAGIAFCAETLGLTTAEVAAVATFYSMYRRSPTGEFLIGVCTNTLCAVLGGDEILAALSTHLGIEVGETTADGRITLEHVECNAACDHAPVVMANWEFFDHQTVDSAIELAEDLCAGVTVTPTRGTGAVCDFRRTARALAGLDDEAVP